MNVVDRAKNIIMTPAREWEVIKTEPMTTGQIYTQYVMVLALIPAIAGFIGRSLVGMSILGEEFRIPIARGLAWAVLSYLLTLVGVYILAAIIDALAPSFGSKKDMSASLKVSAFSMTAAWLAGIFSLIPLLSVLALFGLYSFYLLFIGMRSLKEVPPDKMAGYYVVTLVVAIVVYVVIAVVVSALTLTGYGAAGMMRGW